MNRIIRSIEWNPVKASLVERIEDWPWSSASRRFWSWQAISLPLEFLHFHPDLF
jgi:hypothetical protein